MRTLARYMIVVAVIGFGHGLVRAEDTPGAPPPKGSPSPKGTPAAKDKLRLVIQVPALTGLTARGAQVQLRAANLQARVVTVAEGEVGHVVGHAPAAGTHVQPHSVVVLHVAVAADVPTVMPRLVGRYLNAVRTRYEPIYWMDIEFVDAEQGKPGEIIGQDPAPKARIPFRGRVRLRVVESATTVPVVMGQTERVARARLASEGYAVTVVQRVAVGTPGVVIGQTPIGGAEAARGARVQIVVSQVGHEASTSTRAMRVVTCPPLQGISFHAAHDWLRTIGLLPRTHVVRIDEGSTLHVVSQDPAAGTSLRSGSPVKLTVGRRLGPPRTIPVPLLLGMTEFDGTHVLQGLGFRVRIGRRPSALPVGTVIEQLPAGGSPAAQRSDLVLFVAARPSAGWKAPTAQAPAVSGLTWFAAMTQIYARGLTARVESRDMPTGDIHRVIEQRPAAGTPLLAGSGVTLVVPTRAMVPDLRTLDADEAAEHLRVAGFVVQRDATTPGLVVDRHEPAASFVARGSTVHLWTRARDEVVLPRVIGSLVADAQSQLTRLGLVLVTSEGAGERSVITTQDPQPGTRVRLGSTVTVGVAP